MNVKDYAVRLLVEMLKIYSPSGEEGRIGDFLVKEMENLGFNVWKDEVGNVIGEVGHGEPIVLLCGHMDTVPGYIPVRLENDKLYGRGAVDAKASLAAMVVAAATLARQGINNKILVVGVVDEEGKSRGIRHLIKKGIPANYAVFGEPSGLEKIVIGYRGSLHLKITCETETGHSAAPWLFQNAVEKAFEIWGKIRNFHLPEEKSKSKFYSISACLTKISGGNANSTVPSKCEIHVNIRVPPQFTCQRVLNEINKILSQYQIENPAVSAKMEVEDLTEPFEADKNSPLVRAFSYAIRKVCRRTPIILRKTGTGDMNLLGEALGIPVATYGPGDSRLDHTPNEYIDVQEYLDSIEVYKEGLKRLNIIKG